MSIDNRRIVKAFAKVEKFLGHKGEQYYQRIFARVEHISGANRVFGRISSAKDIEDLLDYLAEIRYAMIFAGLGFEVEFEPFGAKGPDMRIRRGDNSAVVEVTRFRKIYSGPQVLDLTKEHPTLASYGDLTRDIGKAFDKILGKFSQLVNEKGIIAIWNDDEDLEVETKIAVDAIRIEASKGIRSVPMGLLFLLYGSKWIGDKQLHCFPFRPLENQYQEWVTELEMAPVATHIEHALS